MHRPVRPVMLVALLALSCQRNAAMARPPTAGAARPPSASPAGKLPGLDAPAVRPARRQIIRNAELALEDDDPGRAQQRAVALVEGLGGFALSSDALSVSGEAGRSELHINLLLRVPADEFERALAGLRGLGRAAREQVTGEDVTEEYVDLEARIHTERALEAQLLEILKSTKAVGEMMEVHGRLAEVRGEIEKMEGRRRFLDERTSLSTIRIEIMGPAARAAAGFGDSIHRAARDLLAVASGIVNVAIRMTGVLLPVFVMIVLPGTAAARALLRRRAARRALRS